MTNGDKFRALKLTSATDKEIADFIVDEKAGCINCPVYELDNMPIACIREKGFDYDCRELILKFLKQEAKEND